MTRIDNSSDESVAPNVQGKVCAVRDELVAGLLERETAVEAAMLALVTGQHLLLLGPTGTAKSLLVRSLCERLQDATLFEHLLTRFSTPEELFGPLSLSALEQDKYQRITKGTLVEAHIGFLDEVFKANSAILNSLLSLLNERIYHQGGNIQQVPLLSLFAASNETPEDETLNALYDRFMLRVMVPYLADDQSIRQLLEFSPLQVQSKLSLDELRLAQSEVQKLAIAEDTFQAIVDIKHGLEDEGISVSDRRWAASGRLVKAKAWLEGESQALTDHCEVLVHALWSEPSQIRVVERVVSKISNPLNLEAVELEDAAKDLYDQRPPVHSENLTNTLEPLLRQLGDIHTRLETRISTAPASRSLRARQALSKVERWHRTLGQLALRSLSQLHMPPGAA